MKLALLNLGMFHLIYSKYSLFLNCTHLFSHFLYIYHHLLFHLLLYIYQRNQYLLFHKQSIIQLIYVHLYHFFLLRNHILPVFHKYLCPFQNVFSHLVQGDFQIYVPILVLLLLIHNHHTHPMLKFDFLLFFHVMFLVLRILIPYLRVVFQHNLVHLGYISALVLLDLLDPPDPLLALLPLSNNTLFHHLLLFYLLTVLLLLLLFVLFPQMFLLH